jgi:DNA-binding MarR family transcriptional regulator
MTEPVHRPASTRAAAGAPAPAWSGDTRRLLELFRTLGSTTFREVRWRRAADLNLTSAQSQMLFHVHEHPGCHVGDVAKAFGVTLPAVTHIANRLARKHLLARETDPADRRACRLTLTPEGRALVDELDTLQLGALERLLGRLTPRARQQTVAAVEALVGAAVQEAPAANGNGLGRRRGG